METNFHQFSFSWDEDKVLFIWVSVEFSFRLVVGFAYSNSVLAGVFICMHDFEQSARMVLI